MVVILVTFHIILSCPVGVERQVELVFPPEVETSLAHGVVAYHGTGMSLGDVGCMSGNLVRDDTVSHILQIRQGEVLLWSDVTYHRGAHPCNLCRADSRGDMVVARSDIGGQRSEGIERSLVAG